MTGDRTPLRERLAEALTREHHRRARERIEASVEGHCAAFADAVLPVVEAETAALRKRAEEAEADAKSAWQNAEDWHEAAQAKERRAEEAEAAVERVRALCSRGPGPANEYQIWTVDVLAALEPPKETR